MPREQIPSPSLISTYPIFLVLVAVVALSACSGGGGGSGGGGLPMTMNLTAAALSPRAISLDWTAPASRPNRSYSIDMNGVALPEVSSSRTSITVHGRRPNTRYCFVIYEVDFPLGRTGRSNQACATTLPDLPPTTPANIVTTAVSPAQIDVAWAESTDDYRVVGYRIYKDGIHHIAVSQISASDTGLDPETRHCYTVSAYDEAGNESPQSSQACATTPADTTPPLTPTNVRATAPSHDQIDIVWNAAKDDGVVRGYKVFRDGIFIEDTTGTTFADSGLSADTEYCYAVFAYDAGGNESPQSNETCTTTLWIITNVDDTDVFVSYTSLAVDSTDNVHIAYYDKRPGDLKYANDAAGEWTISTIDAPGDVGSFVSITVDSGGKVHLSYYDVTNKALKYATNTAGFWQTYTIDMVGSPTSSSHYATSIATDYAASVHISYYNAINQVLKYATNTSGVWVTSVVDSQGDVGVHNALAVDSYRNVHIAYYDADNHTLKYATDTSGSWITTKLDGTGLSSLAVDTANNVHITFADSYELRYITNTSGQWVASTVDDQGTVGWYSSLKVDSAGAVHIAYSDDTYACDDPCDWYYFVGGLKYATNKSGQWITETLIKVNGHHSSLDLDSKDKVHISYRQNAWLGYATNR